MTTSRNDDGFFVFSELTPDRNYIFLLDDRDTNIIDDILILFSDKKGNETLIKANKEKANYFRYSSLPGTKAGKLNFLEEKDVPVVLEKEEEDIMNTVYKSIKFNTGEVIIRYESYAYLEKLSALLNNNPGWNIVLSGHTDDVGGENFNLLLSKRRAESVKRALVKRGISSKRGIVRYYGETKPVAGNETPEGRQKNRRVEMLIVKSAP